MGGNVPDARIYPNTLTKTYGPEIQKTNIKKIRICDLANKNIISGVSFGGAKKSSGVLCRTLTLGWWSGGSGTTGAGRRVGEGRREAPVRAGGPSAVGAGFFLSPRGVPGVLKIGGVPETFSNFSSTSSPGRRVHQP